jgi:hypothetical protein
MSKKFLTPINLLTTSSDPAYGREGDIYFNTIDKSIRIHNGTVWVVVYKSGDQLPFYSHTHQYDGEINSYNGITIPPPDSIDGGHL